MASLYELTDDYLDIQQALEVCESDDERTELMDRLDEIGANLDVKVENITRMIRNLTADAESFGAEADRLAASKKACANGVEKLKGYLLYIMQARDVSKIRTAIGTWRIQDNPPSVDVLDAEKVPEKYRIPQPDKIDRAAILRDFRATGEIVDGTDIRQGEGLRFR